MPGLVLEGGTFRPIFSSGVMDALLEHGMMFDYVIGVSAGIADGVSYLSRQKGRNLDILLNYRHDKRYIGMRNFLHCKSLFGLDFVYGEIPDKLIPFDWKAFHEYQGTALAGVTNATTGKTEYFDCRYMDAKFQILRATCAIPLVFPPIFIDGKPYYDGGLLDPIPIRKAIQDGQEKLMVVLTRPKGYRKELKAQNRLAARRLRKKYPELEPVLLNRHIAYNETVDFCEQLSEQGKVVLIRPSGPINSLEKDLDKIQLAYREGYEMVEQRLSEIERLFR